MTDKLQSWDVCLFYLWIKSYQHINIHILKVLIKLILRFRIFIYIQFIILQLTI